jgi:hypothetical protein
MYSSVKFLSPIVTGGLPTPGPLAAALGDAWVGAVVVPAAAFVVVEVELEELFDELPHAASDAASRIAATVALSQLMVPPCFVVIVI